MVANRDAAQAETVPPGRVPAGSGWIPTPEPLCVLTFCESEDAFFALGSRDPRMVWRFGRQGDLQSSYHATELPARQQCLLVVTSTYVRVQTVSSAWVELPFQLNRLVDSGPLDPGLRTPTLAAFDPDTFVRYDKWQPVASFGLRAQDWPLMLIEIRVRDGPVLCCCKPKFGVLVMASRSEVVQCEMQSYDYKLSWRQLLPPGAVPVSITAVGRQLWVLDAQGGILQIH